MALRQVRITVHGHVQGVFFRASSDVEAKRLGITGWAKNRIDGAVEICAEGEESELRELIAWANHGPADARVDKVDVRWTAFVGELADFRIVD